MSRLTLRVLIVDDEAPKRKQYSSLVLEGGPSQKHLSPGPILPSVSITSSPEEAMQVLRAAKDRGEPFHVLVTDLFMPTPKAGLWLIRELRAQGFSPEELDVILLSSQEDAAQYQNQIGEVAAAWGGPEPEALASILRPAPDAAGTEGDATEHNDRFLQAVWQGIWKKLDRRFRKTVTGAQDHAWKSYSERHSYPTLATKDGRVFYTADGPLSRKIGEFLKKCGSNDVAVLIEGETGTGKELLARLVHDYSKRKSGPFVAVNCGAIPEELFESELFGHQKGSFTGAVEARRGRLEMANEGSLFLDEVSELSPRHQAKLLRVVQEREYCRVGDDRLRRANVRFIAASNKDLRKAVTNGEFREDLLSRLNVIPFTLPALRQRADDIPALALHFWGRDQQEEGLAARDEIWTEEALHSLKCRSWPANARDLRNCITRLKATHSSGPVTPQVLSQSEGSDLDFLDSEELDTYTSRSQHQLFLAALMHVQDSKDPSLKEVLEWAIELRGPLFGPPDKRYETVKYAWYQHRKICGRCRTFANSLLP